MPTTPTDARALDAALDRALLAEATSRRRTIDLLTEVLDTEARVAALADHAGTLRGALLERARAYRDEHGMAPTWRSDIGSVVLSEPKAKLAVTTPAVFADYALVNHPEHVRARLDLSPAELGAVLSALAAADLPTPAVTYAVDTTWQAGFLKGCAAAGGSVFAPDTGDEVPGVAEVPASAPTLSVRPNAEVKARLVAEVRASTLALLAADADTTADEAPSPLEDTLDADPAGPLDVALAPEDLLVDPADGVVRAAVVPDDIAPTVDLAPDDDAPARAQVALERLLGVDPAAFGDAGDDVPALADSEHLDEGAGAAPDYDDAPVADADAGAAWHAARLAEDPRLSFHLHGSTTADLIATARRLALPATLPTKRTDLARLVLARVLELTGAADGVPAVRVDPATLTITTDTALEA